MELVPLATREKGPASPLRSPGAGRSGAGG